MSHTSDALNRMKPSASVTITQMARDKRAAGADVISLSVGEPDFDTPQFIKDAAAAAMAAGHTKYPPVAGLPELRAAVADKFRRQNGLDVGPDDCFVGSGGKQVIFNAILGTVNPGDEVVIPAPYWVSYPDIARLAGGEPVIVPCAAEQGFKLTPAQLEKAITPRTRWLFLNSPSNPTGSTYSADDLRGLADVLLRHPHVHILTDDIYEELIYDGLKFATIAQVEPQLQARTLTMNGVSKSYAMTGWRIGYATGPQWLIKAMIKLQGQSTSGASTISQWAAVAALTGDRSFMDEWRAAFSERRLYVADRLKAIDGLTCLVPEGAFYVYPSCADWIGKTSAGGRVLESDEAVVLALLDEMGVACVHGAAFGLSPHFRVSYATSMQNLEKAMDRIEAFAKGLKPAG